MSKTPFFNFLFLLLWTHRSKHASVFGISFIMIALLSSVFFISGSIKHETLQTLDAQPDFIIQKIRGGRSVDIDTALIESISALKGVENVSPRVFGRYFVTPQGAYFTVVGIDFFEENTNKTIQKLLEGFDLKSFLSQPNMIVGNGVKAFLSANYYEKEFNFKTPNGDIKKVHIFQTLPHQSSLIANDMIILPIDLAREILGIDENKATDIAFVVPNDAERDNLKFKLLSMHYDTRVITKDDIADAYEHLFNYKGGLFLLLFILMLLTFMLILYQRYSMINASDKKEIGILRALGWSIKDVLKLKVLETLIIGILAFVLGVIAAYVFVFFLGAPLLRDVFLGFGNLQNSASFLPHVEFGLLFSLFLFFIVPFAASVLIPVWKIAVIDPVEVMR